MLGGRRLGEGRVNSSSSKMLGEEVRGGQSEQQQKQQDVGGEGDQLHM